MSRTFQLAFFSALSLGAAFPIPAKSQEAIADFYKERRSRTSWARERAEPMIWSRASSPRIWASIFRAIRISSLRTSSARPAST